MEMLERYLHAVKFWLPSAQQDDIIAELREDLRSQMEDRENALGRTLNEAELAGILKRRGSPVVVANGYLPQKALIGPALFPIYRFVFKLVLLWILIPVHALILGPIMMARLPGVVPAVLATVGNYITSASLAACAITIVFALLERYAGKSIEDWDPRKLPRVPVRPSGQRSALQMTATAIIEMVAGLGFGIWLVAWFPMSFDLNGVKVILTPVWQTIYWPTLCVVFGSIPVGLVTILYPSRPWLRSLLRIAVSVVVFATVGVLLNAGTWVELAAPNHPAAGIAEATRWSNLGIKIGLAVIAISSLADIAQEARRIYRQRKRPAAKVSLGY